MEFVSNEFDYAYGIACFPRAPQISVTVEAVTKPLCPLVSFCGSCADLRNGLATGSWLCSPTVPVVEIKSMLAMNSKNMDGYEPLRSAGVSEWLWMNAGLLVRRRKHFRRTYEGLQTA